MTMFGSQWMAAAGSADIENSALFQKSSSEILSITADASSDLQITTLSFWFRATDVVASGTNATLFSAYTSGKSGNDYMQLLSAGELVLGFDVDIYLKTSATYADGTWYHCVIAVDTTQSTDSNRVKMYVGEVGTQATLVTSFDGTVANNPKYPAQNYNMESWNVSGETLYIGRIASAVELYWDGNISEFCQVNGSQLTPSDFASGGYPLAQSTVTALASGGGANSFHLDNASDVTTDASTQNNDFTASDPPPTISTDTPTS